MQYLQGHVKCKFLGRRDLANLSIITTLDKHCPVFSASFFQACHYFICPLLREFTAVLRLGGNTIQDATYRLRWEYHQPIFFLKVNKAQMIFKNVNYFSGSLKHSEIFAFCRCPVSTKRTSIIPVTGQNSSTKTR